MTRHRRRAWPTRMPEGLHIDVFGDRIHLSRRPNSGEIPTVCRELCQVGDIDLGDTCPLCTRKLSSVSDLSGRSAEHVPPRALGGIVRTRTCRACNQRASASEAELARWWAQSYPARFAAPGLPGYRNAGDVLLRASAHGKPVFIVTDSPRSGLGHVLEQARASGRMTATFTAPTDTWKVALLKSAYLAACLHLGEVPNSPDADHVREIIRSGVFGLDGASIGVEEALPFRAFRIYGISGDEVRRLWVGVALLPWAGGCVPIFGVGIGAVAFVTWPIPDQRQRALDIALRRRNVA